MMLQRILWAYLGAIGLPLIFLPFALLNGLNGSELYFAVFFISPLGMIIALADRDSREHVNNQAKAYRSLASAILTAVFIGALIGSIEIFPTNFMLNDSWTLIPTACPLWLAITSTLAGKKSKFVQGRIINR